MTFPPRWLKRILDAVDRTQQRFRASAFIVAVAKRFGDDRGGMHASLVTFYGMLSVFPLLLLLITFASKLLGPDSSATKRLIASALSEFPVIGTRLADNIHALSRGNTAATLAAALFLLWGSLGLTSALQAASHDAWHLPRHTEPNLLVRTGRGLAILGILLTSVIATTVSASLAASGDLSQFSRLLSPGLVVADLLVNIGTYWMALRLLAPKHTAWRTVLAGALLGGVGWTLLQQIGGYLVSHQLHRTTEIYGLFAIVLGLIFWLSLGARLFVYATEVNVVLAQKAWPRGLFEPSDEVKASLEKEAHDSSEN